MDQQKLYNIVLALSGIFQVAGLVRDLAKTGTADEAAYTASINSIYKIDAKNVPDVYGDANGIRMGLQELTRLFNSEKAPTDPYVSRYVVSVIHLERKLMQNPDMRNNIVRRIQYATSQATHFSSVHPNVIASLAETYVNTLGTLPFRIQVLGQAKLLNQTEIIQKIRALLLAGVRSAVLWRQVGGTRWQLFFRRGQIFKIANEILKNA